MWPAFVTHQSIRNKASLGVDGGFLGGDAPLVNKILDKRIVAGNLVQFTIAQQVGARVPHGRHSHFGAVEEHSHQGGTHAVKIGIIANSFPDKVIAAFNMAAHILQNVVPRLVIIQRGDCGDNKL